MTGKHERPSTTDQQALYQDQVIYWFDAFEGKQPYDFLSNFHIGEPIEETDFGYRWQTGEAMFAAYKATNPTDLRRILHASGPGEAKHIGRSIRLRPDWEEVKYDVMRWVLALKYTLQRDEGLALLDTGDRLLVEGTWWGDRVWGVDLRRQPAAAPWMAPGRNWLGMLLMARRAELRAERDLGVTVDYDSIRDYARRGRRA
jgi:ribA/ribD-fused uncharacterized protein